MGHITSPENTPGIETPMGHRSYSGSRIHFTVVIFACVLPCGAGNASTSPASYRSRLYHLHTGEHIDVVYRIHLGWSLQ
jgi:hypothetical protein